MKRFEEDLRQAARSKRNSGIIASLLIVLLGVVLAGYFLSFRSFYVIVKPPQAKQLAKISITNGIALPVGNRVYSLSDKIDLTVTAPKYQNVSLALTDNDFSTDVTVILLPSPGRLLANVIPSTPVNWYLNDEFVKQSNLLDAKLQPGDYKLSVRSDYNESTKRTVSITAEEDTILSIEIPDITGTLTAEMTPAGTIHIDSKVFDYSKPIKLGPGPHNIKISAPGHHPINDTIIVNQSQRDFYRSYNLQPKPIKIHHNLKPIGGNLFVNGKLQDISNNNIAIPYNNTIEIEYIKQGFITERQSQSVVPGEVVELAIKLKPEFFDIEIIANVVSEVYLGGQLLGSTPLQISVPTIPTTLEVRAAGFETQTKKITPKNNQPQRHNFTLITEKIAKIQKAPKAYTGSTGINMKLIQPQKARYQMGGNRSELGQRANEFLRQIELQRPFYVATHELTERQFYGKGTEKPVVNLSWEEVAIYCNKLSSDEGLIPFYLTKNNIINGFDATADGYRLISEAEWEYLARAYNRPKQTIFPWGDEAVVPPKIGNLAGDKAKATSDNYIAGYQDGFRGIAPQKSFPADQAGIYDLVGNVSEWTNDSYSFQAPLNDKIEVDPLGSYSTGAHVIKGANFKSASRTELRAAFREGSATPRDDVGFRLARYL